ncbi:MAG TPA: hypothetical protein PKW92_09850 [Smithella sp.]|nr:hypothetical protein [Smithella sp.]
MFIQFVLPKDAIVLTDLGGDGVLVYRGKLPEIAKEPRKMTRDDMKGEFVSSPDGNIDFGKITEDTAKAIKRTAAPIRLTLEKLKYIESNHLGHIQKAGYESVQAFINDVGNGFTEIYEGKGRTLLLAKTSRNKQIIFVELVPEENGIYYTVNNAFPSRSGYVKNKKMLWQSAQSSTVQQAEPSLKRMEESNNNIAPSNEYVNTEDVGEELTYNKRNRIRTGIKWTDIKDKNTALKVKETTKQNVYPKPDYQQMIDDGVEPMIAHIVKQVYDSIPTKPPLPKNISTDEALQLYINAVNRVMEGTIKWANDKNAIAVWAEKQARYASAELGKVTKLTDLTEESRGLLDFVYPDGYKNYRPEIMLLGGNKLLKMLQPGYEQGKRAIKEIKAGWPAPQESWQRQGYSIIPKGEVKINDRYVDRDNKQVFYVEINRRTRGDSYKTREEAQAAIDNFKPFLLIDKSARITGHFDTKEQAQEAARAKVKRESKETISEKGTSVEQAERIGVTRRKEGENISTDKLMEIFGFRGVNFGNWMKGDVNEAERQLHLNHAHDSFMDLAEILNVPPEALSLNGMLGVAIGAQGSGAHGAHFVPGVNEINMTRTRGAGALAHEWGHALDHHFGNLAGLEASRRPFLTEHLQHVDNEGMTTKAGQKVKAFEGIRPEIVGLFNKIVNTMNKKTIIVTPEEQIKAEAEQKERAKKNVDGWLKSIKNHFTRNGVDEAAFDKLADRIRNLDLGGEKTILAPSSGSHRRFSIKFYMNPVVAELRNLYKEKTGRVYDIENMKALQSNIDHYRFLTEKESAEHIPQQREESTDYTREAAKLDKGKSKAYWDTEVEKFARAFDAFITDTIAEKAAKNTYLSGIEAAPPKGEERLAINKAFTSLIEEIKTRETDKGVEMYSRGEVEQTEKPLSREELEQHVAELTAGAANMPSFVIVNTKAELPFDAPDDAKGAFHDGKIFLVAESITSTEDAHGVIFHEFTGHFGLRGFFGPALDKALLDIHEHNPLVKKYAAQWKADNADLQQQSGMTDEEYYYRSIEEAIAKMAQENKPFTFADRLLSTIQSLLRNIGMNTLADMLETKTNAEALTMLHKAGLYIRKGMTKDAANIPEPLYPFFIASREPMFAVGQRLRENKLSVEDTLREAAAWADKMDDYAAGNIPARSVITIGKTPAVLEALGAEQLPLVITKETIDKITQDKHSIPIEQLKQIPTLIADPIMVFDSTAQPESFVVMTELKQEGKTVIAAVHLKKEMGRNVVNNIASVYGKDSDKIFIKWIDDGLLRYQNKKKSRAWSVTSGLYLPTVRGPQPGFKNKILFEYDIVKDKINKLSVEDTLREAAAFAKQLNDYASGKLRKDITLTVGKTPYVLERLGAKQLPIVISQDAIRKDTKDKYSLSIELLKELPYQLNDPIMVFASKGQNPEGPFKGFVVMTELQHEGKTVIAAIHLGVTEKHHIVNEIASVYEKDSDHWFYEQIEEKRLLYMNRKKSREWFLTRGLYLPKVETAIRGLKRKILFDYDLVKGKDKLSAEAQTGAPRVLGEVELDELTKNLSTLVKGVETITRDGKVFLKTKSGDEVSIDAVEEITPESVALSLKMHYPKHKIDLAAGKRIAGMYQSSLRKITLVKDIAGIWTLSHEFYHFLEDIGAITNPDKEVLNRKINALIRKDPQTYGYLQNRSLAERRAEWVGRTIAQTYDAATTTGKILTKIRKIIDIIINALGIRTAQGVIRDIKTGKIYQPLITAADQVNEIVNDVDKSLLSVAETAEDLTAKVTAATGRKVSRAVEIATGRMPTDAKPTLDKLKKHWREFWQPFSTINDGDKALSARYQAMGNVAKAVRFIEKLNTELDAYPPEVKKDMFWYLNGDIPLESLPEEIEIDIPKEIGAIGKTKNTIIGIIKNTDIKPGPSGKTRIVNAREMAQNIKRRTEIIGEMLVDRGILTPETFEKHKGTYVHYMYAKHIVGEDGDIGILPSGKLDLSYTQARNPNLTAQQRRELGLIADASVAVPVGMGKALTDIAKFDYLETIANNPDWVWQPSIVHVAIGAKLKEPIHGRTRRYVTMSVAKLAEQVKTYGEKMRTAPSPDVEEIHKALTAALDRAQTKAQKTPVDFVELPNTRNYGPLAGAFVAKPIADDLKPVMDITADQGALFNTMLDIHRKGMAYFKMGKVALNLPTAMRNVVSNIIQQNMRGRSLPNVIRDIISGCESMKVKDKFYEEAFGMGLFHTNWFTTEINDVLNEFRKAETGRWDRVLTTVKNVAKYYGRIDDISKLAIFKQMRETGATIDEAALEAMKWGMDYSLTSRSIKGLRQTIVPFACVDEETEALTQRGWLKYDEIQPGDIALSFSMEKGKLEWKQVNDVFRKQYHGPMLRFKHRCLDMQLTPDHRAVVYRKQRKNYIYSPRKYQIKYACALNTHDAIPVAAPYDGFPKQARYSDDLVQIVAWLVTEGHFKKSCDQVCISQNEGDKAEQIKALLDREFPQGYKIQRIRDKEICFHIHARYGKLLKYMFPDKQLTTEFLLSLTKEQTQLLVDTMIKGDGHIRKNGKWEFLQKNNQTLAVFQMALCLLGISHGFHYRKSRDICQISKRQGQYYELKRTKAQNIDYSGVIWCPSVADNGTWVARKAGQVFITHNTYQYKIASLIAESLKKRPWVLAKFALIYPAAKMLAMALHDLDDDDWEDLEKQLPAYIKNAGSVMILPWKSPAGHWQWVNMEYFFPWGNYLELFRDTAKLDTGGIMRGAGISNPFLGLFYTGLSARDETGQPPTHPFYGTPIYNKLDPAPIKAAKYLEYVVNTWMPSMFTRQGAAGYTGKAMMGQEDRWGKKVTIPQAAARWFGVNIVSVSPEQSRAQVSVRLSDLHKEMARVEADPSRSEAEKNAYRRRLNESKAALSEEAPAAVLPITKAKGHDPVYDALREMAAQGILRSSPPARSLNLHGIPVKMSMEQYRDYLDTSSTLARQKLAAVVNSPAWVEMPAWRKTETVDKIITAARKQVRQRVKAQMMHDHRDKIIEARRAKRQNTLAF